MLLLDMSPKNYQDILGSLFRRGQKVSAVVDNTKPKSSPVLQSELEILIKMTLYWNNKNYM